MLRRIYLVLAVATSLLSAQLPVAPRVAGPAASASERVRITNIPDAPFSATAVLEIKTASKILISKKFTLLARDSKGVSYREEHAYLAPDETGFGRIVSMEISDPVAHITTLLNPAAMEALSRTILTPIGGPPPAPNQAPGGVEDLGTSSMEGLTVQGTRESTFGLLQERWFSDELQMPVKLQFTESSLDSGLTRTITLTQLNRNEPDARLFQVPPGYRTATAPKLVRIDARASDANLITRVEPEYPALAKNARVQGSVEFTATVGADGAVQNLQVVKGHPLLINAARTAVLQWKYRPTLLNGVAVPVVVSAVVTFTLPDTH